MAGNNRHPNTTNTSRAHEKEMKICREEDDDGRRQRRQQQQHHWRMAKTQKYCHDAFFGVFSSTDTHTHTDSSAVSFLLLVWRCDAKPILFESNQCVYTQRPQAARTLSSSFLRRREKRRRQTMMMVWCGECAHISATSAHTDADASKGGMPPFNGTPIFCGQILWHLVNENEMATFLHGAEGKTKNKSTSSSPSSRGRRHSFTMSCRASGRNRKSQRATTSSRSNRHQNELSKKRIYFTRSSSPPPTRPSLRSHTHTQPHSLTHTHAGDIGSTTNGTPTTTTTTSAAKKFSRTSSKTMSADGRKNRIAHESLRMMKGGVRNVKQKPITTEVVQNVCVRFFVVGLV